MRSLQWVCLSPLVRGEQPVLTDPLQCFGVVYPRYVWSLSCWSLPVLLGMELPSDCAVALWRRTDHDEQHPYSTPEEPGNNIVQMREDKEGGYIFWVRFVILTHVR